MRVTCSIHAFCDMLAGEDYQEINAKYRLSVSSLDGGVRLPLT